MDILEARSLFPGAADQVYLDLSLNGLVPTPARDAALEHMEKRVMGRAVKDDLHARAEVVRGQVARLLGSQPGEVAITKNVSEGLNLFAARYGVELGDDAHETAIGSGELRFKEGALRFELSNYNYVGLAAVERSLDILEAIGMERVETHLRGLARRLASGLLELGLPVVGGAPGPHLAHIVAVGERGGGRHDSADDPAMNRLHRHLTVNDVRLSIRRGVLRMSLGIYNNEEDVDRVVSLSAGSW